MQYTGAELFTHALKSEQVKFLFAYPGGQVIDLFDALYSVPEIRLILPRHEQGAVFAADGYARVTGQTGVCLATSGPGATNLVTGIANANADSVPLVCFVGQVPTRLLGQSAFQEVSFTEMIRPVCKAAFAVRERTALAETIREAFRTATSGRPGPVVVELPKDIQQAYGEADYPVEPAVRVEPPCISEHQLYAALERLNQAQKPLFLIGGGIRIAQASQEMTLLAEKTGVPVVSTMMGKGALPSSHPMYVGNLGVHGSYAANTAVSQCDVLFAIGTRFSDRVMGAPEGFAKNASIVQIDIEPAPQLPEKILTITADAKMALNALLRIARPLQTGAWNQQIRQWKKMHPLAATGSSLSPQHIFRALSKAFPEAIYCADVGQNQLWASQFLPLDEKCQLLTSGGLGAMGYGLPSAIGAKLGCPERTVIAIAGDGGIQMSIQELATAAVCELPIIICIFNNTCLGNVRQWQKMFYEQRYSGTCMRARVSCPPRCVTSGRYCPPYLPDFVKLAESYGAAGIRVQEEWEISSALSQAKHNIYKPTIIEFCSAPDQAVLPIVPPGKALDQMVLTTGNTYSHE